MSTIIHCPFCKRKVLQVHPAMKTVKTQKWEYHCEKCDVKFRFIQPEVGIIEVEL